MFSLIITIISIALVAALAVATIYFGGDAFNQGSARAAAATLVNQASQISGANTLYFLDEQTYAAVADGDSVDLAPDYLASVPSPGNAASGAWTVAGGTDASVTIDGVTPAVCDQVNIQAGLTGEVTDATVAQFKCVVAEGDTDGTFTFN